MRVSLDNINTISFEELSETVRKFQPQPFIGFTVNSVGYQNISNLAEDYRRKNEDLRDFSIPCPPVNLMNGLPVVVVQQQEEEFLQWDDEFQMQCYVKYYETL
jgi:hypothetical protein